MGILFLLLGSTKANLNSVARSTVNKCEELKASGRKCGPPPLKKKIVEDTSTQTKKITITTRRKRGSRRKAQKRTARRMKTPRKTPTTQRTPKTPTTDASKGRRNNKRSISNSSSKRRRTIGITRSSRSTSI